MNFRLFDKDGSIAHIPCRTAATVGVFDGVHSGHRDLLRQLKEAASLAASADGRPPATLAVSLTAHPSFVLGRHSSEYWLDDPDEHLQLLFSAGADYVCLLPFTPDVARTSACNLVRTLHRHFGLDCLLTGYDSRFGSRQDDDFDRLPALASELHFTLRRGTPFLADGIPVSSSRIRQSLLDGQVETTATLLGRPYRLDGSVVHGRGIGRTLGFPTANVDLTETRKMLPREGVYAVRLVLRGGQPSAPAKGIANLGAAPTYGIEKSLLEVHLSDFDGDLYGQSVGVEFVHRLRDTVRFDSTADLVHQLHTDTEQAKAWL